MFPMGSGAKTGIPHPAVFAIACACLIAATSARVWAGARDDGADRALAEVTKRAGEGRFAAAESLLRSRPAPPAAPRVQAPPLSQGNAAMNVARCRLAPLAIV